MIKLSIQNAELNADLLGAKTSAYFDQQKQRWIHEMVADPDLMVALTVISNTISSDVVNILGAILAKQIATPATEAKQDAANTSLATIAGKDFATQTTLTTIQSSIAAILTKLADPATQSGLTAILNRLQVNVPVTLNGNLPELRRFASEIASSMPTQNDDGSALVKYQSLYILDAGIAYSWNGTSWVVRS